jgi:hypothetical protein
MPEWFPVVRVTPANGEPVIYDIGVGLVWLMQPLRVRIDAQPDIERREDINRKRHDYVRGFRPRVRIEIAASDDLADAETITAILNAFASGSTVELSLDGGAVYREVMLRDFAGPEPLGGKWFAGVVYELDFECAELISELISPAMGW